MSQSLNQSQTQQSQTFRDFDRIVLIGFDQFQTEEEIVSKEQTPLVLVSYLRDNQAESNDPFLSNYINKFICEMALQANQNDTSMKPINLIKGDLVKILQQAREQL